MAKNIPSEKIPTELLSKINIVKKRILFLSPSVTSGKEHEAKKDDFESLTSASIGTGGFGKVYKVKHKKSHNLYAIKVISKAKIIEQNMCEQIKLEVRIMYAINHEHIIKLCNHFEDDDYFYLVLEYAPKGNLYDRLKKVKTFSENDAAQYLREVVSAVEYLHSLNPPIIHRDIKPENILLDGKDSAKLCDFGWSNFFNSNRVRKTYCGTPDYLSPEMIRQEGHDQRLDIWNLGVLIFEMLTGRPPFKGSNQRELFENILKLKIEYPKDFPKLARDLVSKLLKPNPKERISLKEIKEHPWLKARPTLRPVITREIKMEMKLPTADQDIDELDYEPVSKVSKINHEEERKSTLKNVQSIVENDLPATLKMKNEKDELIEKLSDELDSYKKENNIQKVQIDNLTNEVKILSKENKDLKKLIGTAEFGVESEEKKEIRRLNEELNKLKVMNKDRDDIISQLDKAKETLSETITKNKILENEIDALRNSKKSLDDRIIELQQKIEKTESKYVALKQQFEVSSISKEKSTAELEAKISELQFLTPSKSTSELTTESSESAFLEIVEECKKSLTDIKNKMNNELRYKESEEKIMAELNAERASINDVRMKYEIQLQECQQTITSSIEEAVRKCEKKMQEEISKREKIIDNLSLQLSQVELQEGKSQFESNSLKSLQVMNTQLQKTLNDLRVQVALLMKEQKYLKEMINTKNMKISDLEYRIEQSTMPSEKNSTQSEKTSLASKI